MRFGHRIAPLALEGGAADPLFKLPDVRKDLFDRMLACQALIHGLILLTPDEMIRRYPVRLWFERNVGGRQKDAECGAGTHHAFHLYEPP